MSYMNFGAIYGEVTNRLGNRSDVTARVKQWVNQAQFSIATSYRFYELEVSVTGSTTSSTRSYSLPSDLRVILSLRDTTNSRKLMPADWRTFDKLSQTTGKPSRYTRFGLTMELDPTPDAVYNLTLRYLKRVASMVNDTDEPVLPNEWIEAIILRACWIGAAALQMEVQATEFKNQYVLYVTERKPDYLESAFDGEYGIELRVD
jgi:hypothetical protein